MHVSASSGLAALLGLALLSSPTPIDAQSPGTISGAVTDGGGVGLAGAEVRVGEADRPVVTDARGRFVVTAPEGEATVVVRRMGFAEGRAEVIVEAGRTVRIEITLREEPIDLAPLRVLAERTRLVGDPARLGEVTGAAHLLTRAELLRVPNAFDDVQAALRTLPGVYVQDEEGYGLRPNIGLRGTGVERSARITLMEDGVLVAPAPYAAPAAYYFPVAGRMEAIEVRKGSSQIKYGPRTIGGAVNLVSSAIPEGDSWSADLAGGSDATVRGRVRIGDGDGQLGWLLETYQIGTDGFKELQGGGETGFRLQDYMGKLRWRTAGDARVPQEIELKVGFTDEVSDETYLGLTDGDFATAPLLRYAASREDRMDAEHDQLHLRHLVRLPGGLDLTTTAYRNGFQRNWYKLQSVLGSGIGGVLASPDENPEALAVLRGGESAADALRVRANNRSYVSMGVETILGVEGVHRGVRHALEVGLRLHGDEEDRFQWEDGYRMSAGRMERTTSGTPGAQANRLAEARAVSAFVQDRVEVGDWTFVPGVRLESVDFTRTDWAGDDPERLTPTGVRENGVTAWIPGLGLGWAASSSLRLFGGVHRGFAPPGAGVDPETKPESSVNVEVGVRYRARGLAAEATLFRSDYDNVLGQATLATGGDGSGEQFNGGAVDIEGAEASLDLDPLWGRATAFRLPIRLAYTWSRARFATAFESDYEPWGTVEVGDRLPYLPEHQGSLSIGAESPGWRVEASAHGTTRSRTVAGQGPVGIGEGTDAFVVVGLSAEARVPGGGALYGGIQNLFDERYVVARRPAGVRPGLPRTVVLGYRVSR